MVTEQEHNQRMVEARQERAEWAARVNAQAMADARDEAAAEYARCGVGNETVRIVLEMEAEAQQAKEILGPTTSAMEYRALLGDSQGNRVWRNVMEEHERRQRAVGQGERVGRMMETAARVDEARGLRGQTAEERAITEHGLILEADEAAKGLVRYQEELAKVRAQEKERGYMERSAERQVDEARYSETVRWGPEAVLSRVRVEQTGRVDMSTPRVTIAGDLERLRVEVEEQEALAEKLLATPTPGLESGLVDEARQGDNELVFGAEVNRARQAGWEAELRRAVEAGRQAEPGMGAMRGLEGFTVDDEMRRHFRIVVGQERIREGLELLAGLEDPLDYGLGLSLDYYMDELVKLQRRAGQHRMVRWALKLVGAYVEETERRGA